jgi:hypothetical protein
MNQLFFLHLALVCCSITSLSGMVSIDIGIPQNYTAEERGYVAIYNHMILLFNDYIFSSAAIQAPVMTVLATLPQAMQHIPFQYALLHALNAGIASGIVNTQIAIMSSFVYALLNRLYLPNFLRSRRPESFCVAIALTYITFKVSEMILARGIS